MKKLKKSHTSAKFVKVSWKFSPVNFTWSGAKGKAPSKQIVTFLFM